MSTQPQAPAAETLLDRVARSVLALIVAAAFATAWLAPTSLSHGAVQSLRVTLVLEMFALHSGAFLGILLARAAAGDRRRVASSLAMALPLVALYLIGAWHLSREVHSWWPLVACAWLVVARLLPLLRSDFASRDRAMGQMLAEWLCALGIFVATMTVVQIASLPMLGLEGIDPADYPLEGWSAGVTLADEIQWGALHFSGLALLPWLVPLRLLGAHMEKRIAAHRARRS